MTSLSMLQYGKFEAPARKMQIKPSLDSADLVMTAYAQWMPLIRRVIPEHMIHDDDIPHIIWPQATEALYEEAAALVRPFASELGTSLDDKMREIFQRVSKEKRAGGLFISALINESPIKIVSGKFDAYWLGYRLASAKALVILEGSELKVTGLGSEGIVVNYGNAGHFAGSIQAGGIAINCGRNSSLGGDAYGGITVNFGETSAQARFAWGGMHIHEAKTRNDPPGFRTPFIDHTIGTNAFGGSHVNLGNTRSLGGNAFKGVYFNAGYAEEFGRGAEGGKFANSGTRGPSKDRPKSKGNRVALEELASNLDTILGQLKQDLATVKATPSDAVISSVNWQEYEARIKDFEKKLLLEVGK